MTLTEKITAAIEKIETTARDADTSPWRLGYDSDNTLGGISSGDGEYPSSVADTESGYCGPNESTARHIVAWQPSAALRLCEAARRVLSRHRVPGEKSDESWFTPTTGCFGCGTYGAVDTAVTDDIDQCPELLDLAFALGVLGE